MIDKGVPAGPRAAALEAASAGRWSQAVDEALQVPDPDPRILEILSRGGLAIKRPDITQQASQQLGATGLNANQLLRWLRAASSVGDYAEVRTILAHPLATRSDTDPSIRAEFFGAALRADDFASAERLIGDAAPTIAAEFRAAQAWHFGENDQALKLVSDSLSSHPRNVRLLRTMARYLYRSADPESSLKHWDAAFALQRPSPREAGERFSMGVLAWADDELEWEVAKIIGSSDRLSPGTYLLVLEYLARADTSGDVYAAFAKRGRDSHPLDSRLRRLEMMSAAVRGQPKPGGVCRVDSPFPEESADDLLADAKIAHSHGSRGRQLQFVNEVFATYGLAPVVSRDSGMSISPEHLGSAATPSRGDGGPLVSVIMTAYGFDSLVPSAIRSVLAQTHENLELIIVDDASEDDCFTQIVAATENDARVRVVRMPQNGGTYRAKNYGLRLAMGDFIAFMDSDDFSHPQRIERQVAAMQRHGAGVAMVTHRCFRVANDSTIEFSRGRALRMAFISPLIRRSALETVGYFDEVRVAADSELVRRVEAVFGEQSHLLLPEPLMVVASQPSSLTGGGPFQMGWKGLSGPRLAYRSSFTQWHQRILTGYESGYVGYRQAKRSFSAPTAMLR